MKPSSRADTFKIGYRLWVLWLIVLFDILAVTTCLFFPIAALIQAYWTETGQNSDMSLRLITFLLCFGAFFACNLYTVLTEAFRGNYAIKIDRQGIHLWRATTVPILWQDIHSVEVYDLMPDSRYIILNLKQKVPNFYSPYTVINLHRYMTKRRFSKKMKMFLDGVACDNETLRRQISSYGDKLNR